MKIKQPFFGEFDIVYAKLVLQTSPRRLFASFSPVVGLSRIEERDSSNGNKYAEVWSIDGGNRHRTEQRHKEEDDKSVEGGSGDTVDTSSDKSVAGDSGGTVDTSSDKSVEGDSGGTVETSSDKSVAGDSGGQAGEKRTETAGNVRHTVGDTRETTWNNGDGDGDTSFPRCFLDAREKSRPWVISA
ncbi:hypothetical protein PoB_003666600 [Plakobranchus ocellatus]|uniref:Uncharacterized protein n=1 Tax=Plakobranchus ocellatus TaxID=259542 RepID=A0AAV4APS2_9GAST|nr:hypothetical protein PoB_003666600 [Plakobranchus ocellatus]